MEVISDQRHSVLFDGDCGICSWSAQFADRWDKGGDLKVTPYFEYSESELAAYGLDYEQCVEYLCLVTSDGRVLRGSAAVNFIGLRLFPFSVFFALLYFFPFVLPIESLLYDLVASYRTKISGLFGLDACKIR